ncbi:hypothetical protein GKZ90_0003285 [Flavobacterium sp. MC2016-06]|uniref:hypothetical protein n=1 Tax=Flavobacterium sp. MC2016-06 TaxID=2676308 RepID=UPI0012BA89C5|nr:hypothetical protein [Flavobacterium sp. MC2016-06]MBU3860610.1 hypothetical protein [Flavobacterium sp. MC2016-06]
MRKSFYILIASFFWFTANAQNDVENAQIVAEISPTDTLISIENPYKFEQINPDEDYPWHARRFKVTAGGFFPLNNTQIQVGQTNGNPGTLIDFENDLGFSKSSTSFMGALEWRISRRSRLDFEFFSLNRSATKTLEKQIVFGDNTYDINARVTAFFDVQIARIAYGYAFLSKPKYEAGLLIGAHVLFGDVGLRVDANQASLEKRTNFNFTAPLPDMGIWGEFVLGKRFGLYANVNYLAAKIDNISGRIISYNLSLLYNIYDNLSVNAGYTGLNFRVDDEKERLSGYLKWGYNGPSVTFTYAFGKHVKLYKH